MILAFLPNLAIWRIFEPNRINPRVKHSVSTHIGPRWGQKYKKINKRKNFKIGPKKVLLDHFLALKRQNLVMKVKIWRHAAKLVPTQWMIPKKLKSETLRSRSLPFQPE